MKLITKLIIFTFFTILVPMLIFFLFTAFTVYQSTTISQWEYLENIENNIEKDILETENRYLVSARETATNDLIRAKAYLYSKYWYRMSEGIINYDLTSLNDFIEETSRKRVLDTVSVYRRDNEDFHRVAESKPDIYLPDLLFKSMIQNEYGKAVYLRYPEGIYLRVVYPVFSNGRIVGLILLMKGYNEAYFSGFVETFNIEIALLSKEKILYNSNPGYNDAVKAIFDEKKDTGRIKFDTEFSSFSGVIFPYNLGEGAEGELILYQERKNIFNQDHFFIQKIFIMLLLCIMIPVVTFFIKEIRLIKTIGSLVHATDNISAGNYDCPVKIKSKDEIGILSRNFNSMIDVIKRNKIALETQNQELALKNSYIDAVFESLNISIIVLDHNAGIQVISRNTSSSLVLSEEQVGKHLLSVFPFSEKEESLRESLDTVFNKKKFTRQHSIQFGGISYELDFYPVLTEAGEISAVVLIMNNINQQMNMERALRRSDRLASVGELAAGLAHEINNPMSIILNHVQLLQTDELSKEEAGRFMNRVESEIKRVSRLINNLLKFSREETSTPEFLNAGDLFREVIYLFDPKSAAKKVHEKKGEQYKVLYKNKIIRIFLNDETLKINIFCCRDIFKQIIINIIKNSIQSCDGKNSHIDIDSEKTVNGTRFIITDNGKGIKESDLEKVFDLFYSDKSNTAGTGLGLPLCRSLIGKYGGSINIESREGSGTKVFLFFPEMETANEHEKF